MSEGEKIEEQAKEKLENETEEKDYEAEYNTLEDRYPRANAEFESIKKRPEKEKINAMAYVNKGFAKDLLDVLDALEAAVKVEANDEVSLKIKEGVQNTLDLFLKKLEKRGVKEIEATCEFDPNLHEAMFRIENDEHQSGAVVQVLQKGYKLGERVIRPTKVSVAK